jgi:hypothetical protein
VTGDRLIFLNHKNAFTGKNPSFPVIAEHPLRERRPIIPFSASGKPAGLQKKEQIKIMREAGFLTTS